MQTKKPQNFSKPNKKEQREKQKQAMLERAELLRQLQPNHPLVKFHFENNNTEVIAEAS